MSASHSSDSGPPTQLAILKRGKRQVATQIKNDCGTPSSAGLQRLDDILTFLLNPEKQVDFEATDWCRFLISGGSSFAEYSENVRQFDSAKVCGLVWTANFIAYRCRTCGISPCMSLCPDCFYGADHTGHDFNMFRSHAGGACDCGDVNVMKPEGFCTKHGKRETAPKTVPAEVSCTAKIIIPRLITRFVYYLRSKHQEWVSSGGETFSLDDGEHLLGLLHDLTGLGAVIRTILSQALIDTVTYSHEFLASPLDDDNKESFTAYQITCQEQYVKAMAEMPAPQPNFYRVKVCGRPDGNTRPRTHWRCSYECILSAVNSVSINDGLNHKSALEEILFWTVKYEFPEKITTWLLGLLPDDTFKEEFTKTFVEHYTRISTSLMICKGNEQRQRVSNKVVHVSVQLFSNEVYAIRMTSECQLLTRMVISLYNMLSTNLVQSSMTTQKINTHLVLDCSSDIIKDHCFWPLISDLVNIMSHKPVAMTFMEDSVLLDVWFEMMSFLQGMNLNERELVQHVEYETDTYYASFSAEFEISCSPLWRLLLHCKDASSNTHLALVLRKIMEELKFFFENVGMLSSSKSSKISEYQVSFHLPLHRYFAAFLCSAIQHRGFTPEEELSQEFLKLVLVHPLQIQVAFYEIFAQLWVRNGLQIRGQAMTYTQCHFCNSLVDLDYFLLQVCSAYLDADYFVQAVVKAFHLEHWNTPIEPASIPDNLEPGQDESMLEGCLAMLSTLLSVRTYSGQSGDAVLLGEIVTLLCMSDRTYSQLCDSIPEKSGTNNGPADLKEHLAKVADFKAPGFNVSGKLQQGTYSPKPEVWLENYDPLHTMLRTVHRREFQQSMDRYTEFVQNAKSFPQGQTPWPPLRIPARPMEAYNGIYNLLHTRTALKLCFNLLHKKLHSKAQTVTDTALYLIIFLTHMMVHENEADTKMINAAEDNAWFPHDTVLDNMIHTVATVMVEVSPDKRDKEGTSPEDMETEEDEAHQNIQTMFSHTDSQHSFYIPPQVAPLLKMRGSTPGAISSPAPVVPMESSSSTALMKQVEVPINESLVSLLIKLHNKISDQDRSYVPLRIRGGMVDASNLVGDGPFFVGRVLDSLSTKSSKCAEAIEKVYKDLQPQDAADNSMSSVKKKKRAQDRQKKLLEKMSKMQNKFMDRIEKTMSKEEFEKITEMAQDDNYVVVEHYDCAICSSTTLSTIERPMGVVSLMQSTCVLSFARSDPNPDKLPLRDDGESSVEVFGEYFKRVNSKLSDLFNDEHNNVSALGVTRNDGVFVQSCGHYLHLDCFQAYQESVTSQSRNRQSLASDEYYCPLCRQLANALLPILPAGSDAPVLPVPPPTLLQRIKDMGTMLLQEPAKWQSEIFYREVTAVSDRLKAHASSELRSSLQSENLYNSAHFLYSIARSNLDYILLYEDNHITVPSRKTSIAHLLTTLNQRIKKMAGQSVECLDILSQLTGVDLESHTGSSSLVLHHAIIPFLLRDPITVFIQIYLNLPPNLAEGYLESLISVVYNLAYTQALLHISCKFTEDERQSWLSRGAETRRPSRRSSQIVEETGSRRQSMSGTSSSRRTSLPLNAGSRRASQATPQSATLTMDGGGGRRSSIVPVTGHILHTIIKQLTTIRFYPSDDESMSFLECSVWSPQSIESFIQNRCLPFLEFASLLKKHVYQSELPDRPPSTADTAEGSSQDCQQWFSVLCRHLGLINESVMSDSPSEQALRWAYPDDSHATVKGWLNFLMTCKDRPTVLSLVKDHRRWHMPRLLELPAQYDTIFQHYRTTKCPQCQRLPLAPSICLICGTFVCFKEMCCVAHSGVMHAKNCGSGTSVILDINASIVAIIRGKRATLWGSVYLDEHGEEDRDLKRGKPLYLCKDRYKMLEQQWLSHNFDYVCKRWIFHSDQL